jgi:nicotinamidase-related amidase
MFWKRGAANGSPKQDNESKCVEHPEVGTVISTEDILQKVWIPVVEGNQVFADEFLVDHGSQDGDISNSRQQLVIKPKHCQIGSAGAAVVDSLNTVLTTWSNTHHREVEYLVSQHRGANKSVSPNRDLVPQHNWVYDRNQIEHVASQVERVFFAGQVLGHCHSLHLVSDLAAGMVESLGVGDDKEITVLSDALLICGPTKQDREEMMDEVIVTSQLQQIIISSTQDVLLE